MNRLFRWLLLLFIAVGSIFFCSRALSVHFDYSIERLFPEDDPELKYYEAFRDTFRSEAEFLAVGVLNRKGIFNALFLHRLDSLGNKLSAIQGVAEVKSLATEQFIKKPPLGPPRDVPLVHPDDPVQLARDSIFLNQLPIFRHNIISDDNNATALYLRLDSTHFSDSTLVSIKNTLDAFHFDESHLTGVRWMNHNHSRQIQYELGLFMGLAAILVTISLLLMFRSLWGIMGPLFVIVLSIIWTFGLIEVTHGDINLMTVLITPILCVVGMSDVIHFYNHFLEEIKNGKDRKNAVRITQKEIGLSLLLTSLTTAFGFLTLLLLPLEPFRQFGIYTAAGVMIAYGMVQVLLPLLVVWMPLPRSSLKAQQTGFWHRHLPMLFLFVLHHRKGILAAWIFLTVAAGITMSQITLNSHLVEAARPGTGIRKESEFFEKHFGGIRHVEIGIRLKKPGLTVFDPEVLKYLAALERYLQEDYGLNRSFSLVGNLKAAWTSLNNGQPAYYGLPQDTITLRALTRQVIARGKLHGLYEVVSADHRQARISGSLYDIGTKAAEQRNQKLQEFVSREIPSGLLEVRLTGQSLLLDRSLHLIARNILYGMAFALFVVAILMGVLWRSLKMVIIAAIPNIVPLILVAAIMYWANISFNITTLIVFTIAFGIAVDDTIHLLSRLRIEIGKGRHFNYAIKRSFLSTGKAIIITSLLLVAGFSTLLLSVFSGTFYIGLLIGITLILAVIADLTLIPVLLWILGGNGKK